MPSVIKGRKPAMAGSQEQESVQHVQHVQESEGSADPRVTIVIATMNRRESLLKTLRRLTELPERPAVVVVDNGSRDGTADAVRRMFPSVSVLPLDHNHGVA